MHISHHPLAVLRPDAERLGCHTTAELRDHAGEFVRIAGILAASRRVQTSRGESMQFLTLEDEHGTVEVQLSPAVFRRICSMITTPGPYLVDCHVEEEDGDVYVRGVTIRPFHERHARQNVHPKEDRSK